MAQQENEGPEGGVDVGVLHPGAMGAQVGAQAVAAGARVWWVAAGRSAESRARAEGAGLRAVDSVDELAARCDIILSVCPPATALEVASLVAATPFSGIYADANAISPEHAADVARLLGERTRVVDGGIVGGPPRNPGDTVLYLSGTDRAAVETVRALFAPTALEPHVLPGGIGQASALKLAFASYNKISYVLAAQAFALAAGHDVLDELVDIAKKKVPGTSLAWPELVGTAGPRAWRWAPEMREIADACTEIGVPSGVAEIASTVFLRWEHLKGAADVSVDDLISALRSGNEGAADTDSNGGE
jgi:3-hydroxyisobutyrate dehydrogenase-like beta-hydroxyacid dehydrogenase